jgi:hypothetical protein
MRLAAPSVMRQALVIGLAWVAAVMLSACSAMKELEGVPGTDISTVKVGTTRQQVESVLGTPKREWVTRADVRYCLYRYDAGVEPDPADAAALAFLDIASLGLAELFYAIDKRSRIYGPHKYPLIAVSYDREGVVLGVFYDVGEFTAFPEDGRPPSASAAGASSTGR